MDPAAIDPKSVTGAATFKCFIDAVAFAAEKHRDQRRKARPHPRMEALFDCLRDSAITPTETEQKR